MRTFVPFSGFAPDAQRNNPGLFVDCENVIPGPLGFQAGPSLTSAALPALDVPCTGAALVRFSDDSFKLYVGTATHLYDGTSGASYTDVSRTVGGAYTGSSDDPWRFAIFLDNVVLATNNADEVQFKTTGATDFADLTAAPTAACIDVVNGFVLLANTENSGDEVYNSAYLDYTDWTVSRATQANSYQLLDIPGSIRGLRKFGNKCVAYKDRGMFLGAYVGSPVVWDWQALPGEVGCSSQEAVVEIFVNGSPAHVFFCAELLDFYLFDGVRPYSIGTPLRGWFSQQIDPAFKYLVKALHDRQNERVIFFYPTRGDSSINRGVCYYYGQRFGQGGAWGVYDRTIEACVEYLSGAITYDNLGTSLGNPTYDSLPALPYDSPFWLQAQLNPAVFVGKDNGFLALEDGSLLLREDGGRFNLEVSVIHALQTLTGVADESGYTTGFLGDDQQFTYVRSIRPRFDSNMTSSQSQTNYYQDLPDFRGLPSTGDTVSMTDGRFDMHQSSRWQQFKHEYNGDYIITGMMVDSDQDGLD